MRKQHIEETPLKREDGVRRVKAQTNYLTKDGREKPDPTPIAPPIGYIKQPTMVENIRAMVRREMSDAAAAQGMETFEEADDFEVGDDYDPRSPYEELFDPPAGLPGMSTPKPTVGEGGPGREGEAEPPSPAPEPTKKQEEKQPEPALAKSTPKG